MKSWPIMDAGLTTGRGHDVSVALASGVRHRWLLSERHTGRIEGYTDT